MWKSCNEITDTEVDPMRQSTLKKSCKEGLKDTVGKMFVLHTADLGLIPPV